MKGGYFFLLTAGVLIALVSIGSLSLSLPEDDGEGLPVSARRLMGQRLRSRWSMLNDRWHRLVHKQHVLQQHAHQDEAATAATTPSTPHNLTMHASNTTTHVTHTHAQPPSHAAAAARRRPSGRPARRATAVVASPPPAMGPPFLLRSGLEAACLAHDEELEPLMRATCTVGEARQQFQWEPRTGTLRFASDSTQCVDYLAGLEVFGVWSCIDAANAHFERRDESRGGGEERLSFCLRNDGDACLHAVRGSGGQAVPLRVPGNAACLQLDAPSQPLSQQTCDSTEPRQRWRYDTRLGGAFVSEVEPSLCLDYKAEQQAFGTWGCGASADGAPAKPPGASALFTYHKIGAKYCLRRGRGSTCVQQAASGSAIHLRVPSAAETLACVDFRGAGLPTAAAPCLALRRAQQWIFHAPSASFRPSEDPSMCLQLHVGEPRLAGSAQPSFELSARPCKQTHAPEQRFVFDRYMGKYCAAAVGAGFCLQEAFIGPRLRLRRPGEFSCLQFDGGLQALHGHDCNATEDRQLWTYDAASLVFRHASHSDRCLDYFSAHGAFGVWSCHEMQEVNTQQFHVDAMRADRFCLLNEPSQCLLPASVSPLFY